MWDSQTARVGRKGGRAIAVTMASAKKVRRQKILKIFLPERSCLNERAAVRSPVWEVACRSEMLFVYEELSTEMSDPMRYNGLRIGAVPASAILKYEFLSTEMLK